MFIKAYHEKWPFSTIDRDDTSAYSDVCCTDLSMKPGSRDDCTDVGICLLVFSSKSYNVLGFCDFCFWENFFYIFYNFTFTFAYINTGGYIGITSSVVLSVCPIVSAPEPLNHFLPNLVWWCIIMRWCVMQKNWFTIFNVQVTARAYIIKIWLFSLYLLNCWSVCSQTWFDSTAS